MDFAKRCLFLAPLALAAFVSGCQTSSESLKAGVSADTSTASTAVAADGSQLAVDAVATETDVALPEMAMVVPYPRPDIAVAAASSVAGGNAYAASQQPTAALAAVAAATQPETLASASVATAAVEPRSPELDTLISKYASVYQIPEKLLRRVVHRESRFDPGARNGPYWGLMQIRHDTARGMGYSGDPKGLLDAETNLRYAGKYLRGAYITADGNDDQAVRFYSRGYYYDAKRKGLLEVTGLR